MKKRTVPIIISAVILMISAVLSPTAQVPASESEKKTDASDTFQTAEGRTLANPRIIKHDSMMSGQKVTWDCIWFGSYPQEEVASSDPLYSTLQSAAEWDNLGDTTLEGSRYRRIKKSDATFAASDSYIMTGSMRTPGTTSNMNQLNGEY